MLQAINGVYDARKQAKAAERIKLAGFFDWVILTDKSRFTLHRLGVCGDSPSDWAATLVFESLQPVTGRHPWSGAEQIINYAWGPAGCIDRMIPGKTYSVGTDTYLVCDDVDDSSVTLTIFRKDLVLHEEKERFVANAMMNEGVTTPARKPAEDEVKREQQRREFPPKAEQDQVEKRPAESEADFEKRLLPITHFAATLAEGLGYPLSLARRMYEEEADPKRRDQIAEIEANLSDVNLVLRNVRKPWTS